MEEEGKEWREGEVKGGEGEREGERREGREGREMGEKDNGFNEECDGGGGEAKWEGNDVCKGTRV